MKRILFLIATITLAWTCVLAQDHYAGNISVGGKAGVVMARTQFSPSVPQSFLPGFMVGVTARYIEEKHFGIIAELNLEQRGWKEKFDDVDLSFQRRLTYIHLPILSHIYFGSNKFRGFFNAGPEAAFLISDNITSNFDYANATTLDEFPDNHDSEQYTLDVKNKFDYGISAGFGMEMIWRNKSSFNLEARFYYGLRDVFSNHKKDPFAASSGMALMLTLGYHYRIK